MSFISNNIAKENIKKFSIRFPELSKSVGLDSVNGLIKHLKNVDKNIKIVKTKSDDFSLQANNMFFHSRYSPLDEAKKVFDKSKMFGEEGCVFLGLGLGYFVEAYFDKHPNSKIVIIEPSLDILVLALAYRNLNCLFSIPNLIFICQTNANKTPMLLETIEAENLPIFETPNFRAVFNNWYNEFHSTKTRLEEKKNINKNTLKKFGTLWQKNIIKNTVQLTKKTSIYPFFGKGKNEKALLISAGPSLNQIGDSLKLLQKKFIIIAVDTTLRFCLKHGVEPDFIVLTDPQYINWKHLSGLSSPSSILITELAAWPSVYKFNCKSIVLSSSRFPLAKYFENICKPIGLLGAGGSVTTTAWDFACYLGIKTIYVAGLDLAYPEKQTHFKGSLFEENVHISSNKLNTSETKSFLILYDASPYPVKSNTNKTVITDKRLSLFSWWFETRLAQEPEVKTFSITKGGMNINGIKLLNLESVFSFENRRESINKIKDANLDNKNILIKNEDLKSRFLELIKHLESIIFLTNNGLKTIKEFKENKTSSKEAFEKLKELDYKFSKNPAREVVSFYIDIYDDQFLSSKRVVDKSYNLYFSLNNIANNLLHYIKKYYK